MKRHLRLNPRVLLFVPLLLVLIAAVACGEDATSTPRPTATSVPTATAVPPTPTTAAVEPTATLAPTKRAATATPRPTATPLPTPLPSPTPGFATSSVDQMRVAMGPQTHESNLLYKITSRLPMNMPMMESLLTVDRFTGVPIPQLATKWEMQSDAKAWTFFLREDVPFHFGWGEFTAQDVRHMYQIIVQTPDSISTDGSTWRTLIEKQEDIELIDDHTVKMNLTKADSEVNFHMSGRAGNMFLISKAQWDAEGEEGLIRKPAHTGSWQYVNREISQFILFERVEDHWRRTPEFKELKIIISSEDSTRLAMALTKEAHAVDLPKDLQEEALSRGWRRVVSPLSGTPFVFFFGGVYFATPEKMDPDVPLTNRKVREAMHRSIDRHEIIETIFHGRAAIAPLHTHISSMPGWDPGWLERFEDEYGYDPERAKELLADAGYPDGFDMKLYNYPAPGYPEQVQLTEALHQYFSDIGINVSLVDTDYGFARKKWRGFELRSEMLVNGPYGAWLPSVLEPLMHGNDAFFPSYTHPFIGEKLAELDASTDPEERDQILVDIGEHLYTEYAVLPIVNIFDEYIIDPDVIAEYNTPGNMDSPWSHLEYVVAAK